MKIYLTFKGFSRGSSPSKRWWARKDSWTWVNVLAPFLMWLVPKTGRGPEAEGPWMSFIQTAFSPPCLSNLVPFQSLLLRHYSLFHFWYYYIIIAPFLPPFLPLNPPTYTSLFSCKFMVSLSLLHAYAYAFLVLFFMYLSVSNPSQLTYFPNKNLNHSDTYTCICIYTHI